MTTATPGLRARKNERTRAAITLAALELTAEHGFERATIAQIAERADVSPRTVHQWFPSKEAIIIGSSQQPGERLAAELADGDGDVLDRVERWMLAEGERRTESEELSKLRHRVLLADPHLRALQRARLQDIEAIIAAAIARDTGLAADAVAPRALAAAITTTLLAIEQRYVEDARDQLGPYAGAGDMLRAALSALGAPAPTPRV